MKIIYLEDKRLYDYGKILIIIPNSLCPKEGYIGEWKTGCGGFRRFTTHKGREAIEVKEGKGYILSIGGGGGDRTWRDWESRKPIGENVFAAATPTTNGGGWWHEITVVPAHIPIKTAEEEEALQEIAGL